METQDLLYRDENGKGKPRKKRPRIAVTLGDPNGIGPEVVLKCLTDSRLMKFMEPIVVGSPRVLRVHAQKLGFQETPIHVVAQVPERVQSNGITILSVEPEEHVSVEFGKIAEMGGRLAMQAVEKATDLCLEGKTDAMVTAPISKEAISLAGYNSPGHTEFIAGRVGATNYTMMMVADALRVGLLTGHIPVWDVPKRVKHEAIVTKLHNIHQSLVQDFGITRPRIAVLGLNPHAGDGGILGREEVEEIMPAIEQACKEDMLVFGPFPADGFFATGGYRAYDAVLAMYHDQGLVPFKLIAFDTGVNFTAGVPIVRTSPDHGTAYDIAGKGKARPDSMRSAIYLAIDVARRRTDQLERRIAS